MHGRTGVNFISQTNINEHLPLGSNGRLLTMAWELSLQSNLVPRPLIVDTSHENTLGPWILRAHKGKQEQENIRGEQATKTTKKTIKSQGKSRKSRILSWHKSKRMLEERTSYTVDTNGRAEGCS